MDLVGDILLAYPLLFCVQQSSVIVHSADQYILNCFVLLQADMHDPEQDAF